MPKRELSGAAQTAAEIRKRLKKEFPGINFSVKSSTFSMGNSVDISWTDGPLYSQVDAITCLYKYGHYDGMTDCYDYSKVNPALNCPGAKFVHCTRSLSPEYKEQIQAVLEERFALSQYGDYAPYQWEEAEKIMLGISQEPEEIPEAQEEFISSVAAGQVPQSSVKSNVIDFTARLKVRQEQEQTADFIKQFEADYLPYMNESDRDLLASALGEMEKGIALMLVCMRIDGQRSRG